MSTQSTDESDRDDLVALCVISLPHRQDRRLAFLDEFASAPPFTVYDGVPHPTPHVGCGLAHARTIQRAFASNPRTQVVFVLEDDARLRGTWDDVRAALDECVARRSEWDAVALGSHIVSAQPLPERVERVSASFLTCSPTYALSACTAMAWTRSALPFLAEYEALVSTTEETIPIDRVIFGRVWNVWRSESAPGALGFQTDSELTFDYPERRVAPHLAPRVWISTRPLFFQAVGDMSDNVGMLSLDWRALNEKGYAALGRRADACSRARALPLR
jgi:hypothetical protein